MIRTYTGHVHSVERRLNGPGSFANPYGKPITVITYRLDNGTSFTVEDNELTADDVDRHVVITVDVREPTPPLVRHTELR